MGQTIPHNVGLNGVDRRICAVKDGASRNDCGIEIAIHGAHFHSLQVEFSQFVRDRRCRLTFNDGDGEWKEFTAPTVNR